MGFRPKPGTGALTRVWRDPDTGHEYATRAALEGVRRERARRMMVDFELMVREKTLGQDPWKRLPGETELSYKRFHGYLTMTATHPKRSVAKLAAVLGIRAHTLETYATRWHWKLRARLWDESVDEEALREHKRQKHMGVVRQAKLGRRLQEAALEGAARLLSDEERLKTMDANGIAKLADIGVKVERLANQDATEVVDHNHTIIWNGPMPGWAAPKVMHEPKTIEGEK